jgi:hypothetical protein
MDGRSHDCPELEHVASHDWPRALSRQVTPDGPEAAGGGGDATGFDGDGPLPPPPLAHVAGHQSFRMRRRMPGHTAAVHTALLQPWNGPWPHKMTPFEYGQLSPAPVVAGGGGGGGGGDALVPPEHVPHVARHQTLLMRRRMPPHTFAVHTALLQPLNGPWPHKLTREELGHGHASAHWSILTNDVFPSSSKSSRF